MANTTILILIALNLGLIFLLMAAPIGTRTIAMTRMIKAPRKRIWSALWPLGENADWSKEILSCEPDPDHDNRATLSLSWEGRDGNPIRRLVAFDDVVEGQCYRMRVLDDTSLDSSFWASFEAAVILADTGEGTSVTVERRDRYRGAAFLIFRYFATRRELIKLAKWAKSGEYRRGGLFEHPATQLSLAVLSVFLLWPIFGFHLPGFLYAASITAVVALHELGHMLAFRMMGHKRARMIFIPLLGGIAIGGRPYDSRFEVAFSALMGAGFSAFLVPLSIALALSTAAAGLGFPTVTLTVFAACLAVFNLANLVPVWKFDGGQVLRQICPNPYILATCSFIMLSAFLGVGHVIGLPPLVLAGGGAVVLILSFITSGLGVKPRFDLKPMSGWERTALAGGLVAAFSLHANGVYWATAQLSAAVQ